MCKKLIIFLLCKKLGIKKYDTFRFDNQRSKLNVYYFTDDKLLKIDVENQKIREANVRLNWLLDDDCKVIPSEIPDDICKALVFAWVFK